MAVAEVRVRIEATDDAVIRALVSLAGEVGNADRALLPDSVVSAFEELERAREEWEAR